MRGSDSVTAGLHSLRAIHIWYVLQPHTKPYTNRKKEPMSATSTASGVDLKSGDSFSSIAGAICKTTWDASPFVKVHDLSRKGHFRGPRGVTYKNLPDDSIMVFGPDGVGTKVIISTAAATQHLSAYDLLAMTAGDITRFGGISLVFTNVLDAKTLGKPGTVIFERYKAMMEGLAKAAKKHNFVCIGGETAELSACVTSEIDDINATQYNWAGMMTGFIHPDKLIDGSKVKSGNKIIALRDGLRSNGASLVRKMLREKYGPTWWNELAAHDEIANAARPSTIYDSFFVVANNWYKEIDGRVGFPIHSIAHISGGGIRTKFAEDIMFPLGFSARLDNLWEPSLVMRSVADHFTLMDDAELHETLNGGQGALFIVAEEQVETALRLAVDYRLEAQVCGEVLEECVRPRVEIVSKYTGKTFSYEAS